MRNIVSILPIVTRLIQNFAIPQSQESDDNLINRANNNDRQIKYIIYSFFISILCIFIIIITSIYS